MKYCDTCHSTYPNEFTTCPKDGTALRQTSELMPGTVIRGKYEIVEKIGAGGMGSVYRAKHLAFNEIRAIKVVSSRLLEDESLLRRFKTEAIITRKLQHPNAVRVDDLDTTDDGRPFIVMEFVQGRDLRKVIEQEGPMPVSRALAIIRQVCAALDAAHALGITHRDIKPDNILLVKQPDGTETVKVLDFGIAKVREGAMDVGAGYTATKTGMVVGTPQYLSPEQALGKSGDAIDGRSDLYSLGIVLYEMLTGKLPFESDTPMGLLLHHIQTVPRAPHEVRPDLGISPGLSAVLMRALEKNRDLRFQTAAEMLRALEQPEMYAGTALMGSDVLSAPPPVSAPAGGGTQMYTTPPITPAHLSTPARATPLAAAPTAPVGPLAPAAPAAKAAPSSNRKMAAGAAVVLVVIGLAAVAFRRSASEPAPTAATPPPSMPAAPLPSASNPTAAAQTTGSAAQEIEEAAIGDPEAPGLSEPERQARKQKLVHMLMARAKREVQQGNYEGAIRSLERAARIDPDAPAVQEAIRRARRAWETEQHVLRRRK
ncbi:MAG TPA: protein kinase [Terriglobales bacterium]|nr:protein kinase [Terriglobales bacterium]